MVKKQKLFTTELNGIRLRTSAEDKAITIRIPDVLKYLLVVEAKKNGRSTSSEISYRLAESIRNKN